MIDVFMSLASTSIFPLHFDIFEPYSTNSKGDSCDKHSVSTSIINMSEVNSILGTVGTWVGGFLVLLVSSLLSAYISRSVTRRENELTEKQLLYWIKRDTGVLCDTEKSILDVLLRLEKMALEVENESGDVPALQRVPRASAQVIDANNPGRA